MERTERFSVRLNQFVDGCQKIIKEAKATGVLSIDPDGRKYIRIVNTAYGSRSVFCFVEATTGDVLKADGWKRPAKHARGNIFDEYNGLSRIKWTGPEYLR